MKFYGKTDTTNFIDDLFILLKKIYYFFDTKNKLGNDTKEI